MKPMELTESCELKMSNDEKRVGVTALPGAECAEEHDGSALERYGETRVWWPPRRMGWKDQI